MARKTLLNETGLLDQIAGGDERAFSLVYDFYYNQIYTFVVQLLKSDVLAEEVVQETFLKLWKQGYRLRELKKLDSFLIAVARNRSIDILRRNKLELKTARMRNQEWTEMHNETEESIILSDTRKMIQQAIDLLPEQQKQVYQLCHQEGLKYEEAAQRLNLSVLTVQSYMKLALKNLRKQLANRADLAALLIIFKLF